MILMCFIPSDNFMSLSLNIPTALVIHDLAYLHYPRHIPWLARQYYRLFMPKFIAKADRIITVSQFVKEDVLNKSDVDEEKVDIVHNALPVRVPNEDRSTYDFEYPYFVYVGSINQRKNIKNALLAFEEVQRVHTDMKFVLIGKKYNLDSATDKVFQRLVSGDVLIHLQNVSDGSLMGLLRKAKALVYISLFEGFGIPLLEAMDAEIPIITSNVSSMPEVVGDAGLKVDPNNIREIAAAMARIIHDSELCQTLVSKGRSRLAVFSWEKSANKTYSILKKIADV